MYLQRSAAALLFQEINVIENFIDTALSVISGVRILDIVDIAIVAFAIYKTMQFISQTRARQLVKGLLFLIVIMLLSSIFKLYTVHFILYNGLNYGLMAIVIIFYPELRRALEYLGRGKLFSKLFISGDKDKNEVKGMISQICSAVDYFSSNKVGALIVIEREIALGDIAGTGTVVDADVSAALLETIFYEGSALHDGAVIVRADRVYAAGCVLPLTQSKNLEKTLGTRHRAGIGITEVSDALVIIVSEETGIISSASEGKLSRFLDVRSVEKLLYSAYLSGLDAEESSGAFLNLFRRKK